MPGGSDGSDSVLDALLALLSQDPALGRDELLARFPGCEREIERALSGLDRYRAALRRLAPDPAGDRRLSPGDHLGDHEVVRALAAGGMGELYLARDARLGGREVVLKVLPARARRPLDLQRFEREARLLAGLHHPSLPEVYRFGEERGVAYLAMRLVPGRTLHAWLAEWRHARPADLERRAVRWVAQVGDALACVHARGLVHRDVKPSNIVIEEADGTAGMARAVLVDFGLAREVDARTLTTASSPATLSYAPPEQILGSHVDARADVFALGATLHDLLAGRLPEERERAAAGLEPLPELWPDVDPVLAEIVARAVDPRPRWRQRDARELCTDLERWLAGEPPAARRVRLFWRLRRALRRRPGRLASAVAPGAAILLVVTLAAPLALGFVHARRFAAARARHDLERLQAAAAGIPGWTRPLLLDAGERELALALETPGDPLHEIAALERAGDHSGALLAAAIHVRRHGWAARALASELLLGALRSDGARRDEALALVARVAYERPAGTRADFQACAPVRAELARLWGEELGDEERLAVLCAFSGCGGEAEAEPALSAALDADPFSERARLALSTVERILLRGPGCSSVGAEARRRLARAFGPFLERLLSGREPADQPLHASHTLQAALYLTRTLGLLQGEHEAALLREPWLAAESEGRLPPGECASILAGPGHQAGRALCLRGDDLPDEDTLLGATGPTLTGELVTRAGSPKGDALARWDFTALPVVVSGAASGVRVEACAHEDNEDRTDLFVKFSRFEESRIRLRFELEREPATPLRLELWDVIAARPCLPHAGVVVLDALLDGVELGSLRLCHTEPPQAAVMLPREFLGAGPHELELRSAPGTTTTYRLHEASLLGR